MSWTDTDLKAQLEDIDGIVSVTPMDPAEMGYGSAEDFSCSAEFGSQFDAAMEGSDRDERVCLYYINVEGNSRDHSDIYETVEGIVSETDTAVITGTDPGVPTNDWSGWGVDPVIEVLVVRGE